mmetsp:Transcript_11331/g.21972  ORF Transcript_11331/g.21972 Transcript_11331/m.21972 type:complete len:306 (-) Transcript_11331:1128-2045(-)
MAQLGQDLRQAQPLGQQQADTPVARQVAGGGQHEITQARQTHEGLGLGAQGQTQSQHLRQAARDQRRTRVQAGRVRRRGTQAIADADRNRHHVLDRTAHLDTDRVARCVDPQPLAVEGIDGGAGQGGILAGRNQRGGPPGCHLLGKAGPGQHAHRHRRLQLAGDLVPEPAGARLEALAQPQHPLRRRQGGEGLAQAGHRRRHDGQAFARMGHRPAAVGRQRKGCGQFAVGQIGAVAAAGAHRVHGRSVAAPQTDRMAGPRGLDGQRRAPGPGAEHTDLHRPHARQCHPKKTPRTRRGVIAKRRIS